MEPQAERPRTEDAADAVERAGEAAGAGPLAQRVSELETALAGERAESARRLKELDGLMRQTRSALHDLQGEFRRTSQERDEVQAHLEAKEREVRELRQLVRGLRDRAKRAATDREGATAEVVSATIARAQRSEAELARARQTIEELEGRLHDVSAAAPAGGHVELLERSLAQREEELVRAAERLTDYEERLASGGDDAPDTADDLAAPVTHAASSTYIPIDADMTATDERDPATATGDRDVSASAVTATGTREAGPDSAGAVSGRARVRRRVSVVDAPSPRARPRAAFPVVEGVTVEREVSRDATGALFEGRDISDGDRVHVRVLPRGVVRPSPAIVERLIAVRHHNVVPVLRCGLSQAGPYVVSARPRGETVGAWIERVGRVSERIALAVVLQVARGLREADARGVHHGEIAPSRLWTDGEGVVRVEGIGLGELSPHGEGGAPAPFLSPERRRGELPDARSDMFSLGVCLRYLVGGPDAAAEPDALTHLEPSAHPAAVELVGLLTAHDPEDRPRSWDEVVALAQATLAECPAAAPDSAPDASAGDPDGPWGSAVRCLRAAGWLLVIALLGAGAWSLLMPGDESELHKAYNAAVERAEDLERLGNVEGARRIYMEYVEGTGDPDVELDAARRLDALRE